MTSQHQATQHLSVLTSFNNLFARENKKWWGTRRWWTQLLIWLVILNGFVVFGLFVMPGLVENSVQRAEATTTSDTDVMTAEEFKQDVPNVLFGLATFFLPIGVIILSQNQVYGEKQSGVTAWILSKPVARSTYLLAKLIADAISIHMLMVIVQMMTAYVLLTFVITVDASNFVLAVGLLILLLLFYQSFTLMMSVLGNSTEIVMGVSLGFLLSGLILKNLLATVIGDFIFLTPWMLPDVISAVISGQPLLPQMLATIIAVPLLTLSCLVVMFWQFSKQEL